MDKMSLFTLITVSLPEFCLSLYIIILMIDGRKNLSMEGENVLKYFACIGLLVLQTYAVRLLSSNLIFSFISQVAIYLVIVRFIYFKRKSIKPVLLGVFGYILMQLTLELLLVAPAMVLLENSIHNVFGNDFKRLLYSLPVRAAQMIIIITLWKWQEIRTFIEEYKRVKNLSIVTLILLVYCEIAVLYCFLSYSTVMMLIQKIILCSVLFALSLVNILFLSVVNNLSSDMCNKLYSKIIDVREGRRYEKNF